MQEIWRDIEEFKGRYQVSNLGRVKSLPRLYNNPVTQITKLLPERILNPASWHGYQQVCLTANNAKYTRKVHRLVAIAFIPNPERRTQVNHINGVKHDNRVENLEWATPLENMVHARANNLWVYDHAYHSAHMTALNHSKRKPVQSIEPNGAIREFNSATEASKFYGKTRAQISEVCRGLKHSWSGVRFRYIKVETKDAEARALGHKKSRLGKSVKRPK